MSVELLIEQRLSDSGIVNFAVFRGGGSRSDRSPRRCRTENDTGGHPRQTRRPASDPPRSRERWESAGRLPSEKTRRGATHAVGGEAHPDIYDHLNRAATNSP